MAHSKDVDSQKPATEQELPPNSTTDATTSDATTSDELVRVRDILFGSTARTYENQIAALQKRLASQEEEVGTLTQALAHLRESTANQQATSRQEMIESQESLEAKIESVQTELLRALRRQADQKVDRQTLGQLLVTLGQTILDTPNEHSQRILCNG